MSIFGYKKLAAIVVIFAGLVGCGTAPQLQKASQNFSQNTRIGLQSPLTIFQPNHIDQYVSEENAIVYRQVEGGGGVGLGVFLGPIGVAANIAMIKAKTAEEVKSLQGKLTLKAEDAFNQAAASLNLVTEKKGVVSNTIASPFIWLSKIEPDKIAISVNFFLSETQSQSSKWQNSYQYQLPFYYTLAQLASLSNAEQQAIQAASVEGYKALLQYALNERDEKIAQEPQILIRSPHFTPRIVFEIPGSLVENKADRVWVRLSNRVSALLSKDITYQVQQRK